MTDNDATTAGEDADRFDLDDVVIELARSEDVARVTDEWVSLADEQLVHGSHVRSADNREAIGEILAAYRVADGLLVARVSGTLAGFATFTVEHGTLELDENRGTLSNLYVIPAYRGRGIGTALLEAVESALAERGVTVLTLEVLAANERARRFYRRNGYEPQRVVMERSLEDR